MRSVIINHLNHKNPRFECYACGNEDDRITVPLMHLHDKPASKTQLALLQKLCPSEYDHLKELYSLSNGFLFHMSKDKKSGGLYVFPVESLKRENKEWKEWICDYPEESLHDYQRFGFAFATIASSGNYFVVYKGKIYYSDHDGGTNDSVYKDLKALFTKAFAKPAKWLNDAGCYTRYHKGRSNTQYIPCKYIYDK